MNSHREDAVDYSGRETLTLTIQAPRVELAINCLRDRRFDLSEVIEQPVVESGNLVVVTVTYSTPNVKRCIEWFAQDRRPPYPDGALIRYTMR